MTTELVLRPGHRGPADALPGLCARVRRLPFLRRSLLPVFGFLFGFGFGAQTVQALFGEGFLSTVTSWLVGLLFAVSFALFSYSSTSSPWPSSRARWATPSARACCRPWGFDFGFLVWLVGLLAALAFAAAPWC